MQEQESYKQAFFRRIRALRTASGHSQATMGKALGLHRDTYAKYETRSYLPHELIPKFVELTGAEARWLLGVPGSDQPDAPFREVRPVEHLGIEAAGGGGSNVDDFIPRGESLFPTDWLRRHGIHPDSCLVIGVRGESMRPTLPNGCAILIDRSRTVRREGQIYVVRTEDGLIVKRASRDRFGLASLQRSSGLGASAVARRRGADRRGGLVRAHLRSASLVARSGNNLGRGFPCGEACSGSPLSGFSKTLGGLADNPPDSEILMN